MAKHGNQHTTGVYLLATACKACAEFSTWWRSKMAAEQVEATLTSSQHQTGITTKI